MTLPPSVDYEYDELGNRIAVSYSTPYVTQATDPDVVSYTTNSLNQYTGIANPRGVVVTGFGKPPPGVVTINDVAVDETDERKGMLYARRLEAAGSGAAWMDVEVESSVDVGSQTVTAKREGHRWVPPAQETFSYDADGNLLEDGRWEYTWDGENRLIGMETTSLAAAAGVPTVRLEFGYDAWGRRVMKRVWDVDGASETLRNDVRFVYHGWNLVAEMEMKGDAEDAPVAGSGVANRPFLRRSYLWGEDLAGVVAGGADLGGDVGAGGVGGLLAVTRHERGAQGEETYWACADLNGNVIGLISATTTKLAVYEYDPFGKLMRVNEPEEGLNPIRFSSKYVDAETGMSYYGFRYYDPEQGRWLNRDPVGEWGGRNLMAFVHNEPLSLIDRLGNEAIEVDHTVDQTISDAPQDAWNGYYDWHSKFSLEVLNESSDCKVVVTARLQVTNPVEDSVVQGWKTAIENKWSDRFKLCCDDCPCADGLMIVVKAEFNSKNPHYKITANLPGQSVDGRAGQGGTASMEDWGVDDTVDITHEFGHMLGNREEYHTINRHSFGRARQRKGNVMNNPAGPAEAKHYWLIAEKAGKSCRVIEKSEKCAR